MRDRKRRSKTKNGVFRSEKKSYLILRKSIYFFLIENADRKTPFFVFDLPFRSRIRSKTENGVFPSGFFDQKKKLSILEKDIYIFLIEKSRSKNAVFRFRSRIRSGLTTKKNTGL